MKSALSTIGRGRPRIRLFSTWAEVVHLKTKIDTTDPIAGSRNRNEHIILIAVTSDFHARGLTVASLIHAILIVSGFW